MNHMHSPRDDKKVAIQQNKKRQIHAIHLNIHAIYRIVIQGMGFGLLYIMVASVPDQDIYYWDNHS